MYCNCMEIHARTAQHTLNAFTSNDTKLNENDFQRYDVIFHQRFGRFFCRSFNAIAAAADAASLLFRVRQFVFLRISQRIIHMT